MPHQLADAICADNEPYARLSIRLRYQADCLSESEQESLRSLSMKIVMYACRADSIIEPCRRKGVMTNCNRSVNLSPMARLPPEFAKSSVFLPQLFHTFSTENLSLVQYIGRCCLIPHNLWCTVLQPCATLPTRRTQKVEQAGVNPSTVYKQAKIYSSS